MGHYSWADEVTQQEVDELFPRDFVASVVDDFCRLHERAGIATTRAKQEADVQLFMRALIVAAREGDEDSMWRIGLVRKIRRDHALREAFGLD